MTYDIVQYLRKYCIRYSRYYVNTHAHWYIYIYTVCHISLSLYIYVHMVASPCCKFLFHTPWYGPRHLHTQVVLAVLALLVLEELLPLTTIGRGTTIGFGGWPENAATTYTVHISSAHRTLSRLFSGMQLVPNTHARRLGWLREVRWVRLQL